jgi:uncharacterized protein YkwD
VLLKGYSVLNRTPATRPQVRPTKYLKPLAGCLVLMFAVLICIDTAETAYTQSQAAHESNYAVASPLAAANSAVRSQYFAATGKTARGDFLTFFQRYGLASIGYPIEDEHEENGRKVQYFERVRLEQKLESVGSGRDVTLGRLGAELTEGQQFATVKPFTSTATKMYVKETGHSLEQSFLDHWKRNGGVELFGYPVSEPFRENGLIVQWFERARFEYHPELAKSGRPVQLTLLGRSAMERASGKDGSTPQTSPPAADALPAVNLTAEEDYLFKAINEQRASAGIQPVRIDSATIELARARSNDMAARNYFSHQTPEGTNFLSMMTAYNIKYKFAGEILARNNFPDAEAGPTAISSYLSSAAHKSIMLDARFQLVGVSHAQAADQKHYYTVIFVQP